MRQVSGVCSPALAQDSGKLATGYCDYTVAVWDITQNYALAYTLNNVREFECESQSCGWWQFNRVKISPHGDLLASVIRDARIPIWDLTTGQRIATIEPTGKDQVFPGDLAFGDDGTILATSKPNGIFMHDATSGQIIKSMPAGKDTTSENLEFSPDGKLLISSDSDGKIQVWGIISLP